MAETRQENIAAGLVVEAYQATRYEKINVFAPAAVPGFIGFKSTIPPFGSAGAFRTPVTDEVEFYIGPGDSVYLGNGGPAQTAFSLVASPLPFPVDLIESLGLPRTPPAECFNFDGVPAPPGDSLWAYEALDYTAITIGIRISTIGNGAFCYKKSMDNAYIINSALPGRKPTNTLMEPGDQLFIQGVTGPMDFQLIASPTPWWNKSLWKMAREIEWPKFSHQF